jgi:hypothetical protein
MRQAARDLVMALAPQTAQNQQRSSRSVAGR